MPENKCFKIPQSGGQPWEHDVDLGPHLFVKVSSPRDSEVAFSIFE